MTAPPRNGGDRLLADAVDASFSADARSDWESHLARERVVVGRQGIFTARLRPFGSQLSYRPVTLELAHPRTWPPAQHERATADVLGATFGGADLEQVAERGWLFVRCPRGFLVGDLPLPARPDRLVVEVPGHVSVDQGVLDGLRRLRGRGFRISISGFVDRAEQRRLLSHADFVRIDVRDLDVEGSPVVDLARSHGALLIAEFVEAPALLAASLALGFDLVQGNFLERTQELERATAPRVRRVS